MSLDPRRPDHELEDALGGDPELLELSRRLRAARPEAPLGPHFQQYLRARLMDAAERELRPCGLRRLLPRGGWVASGAGVLGLAMIAAVVVTTVGYHPHDSVTTVAGTSPLASRLDIDPNDVITVSFNEPMDHSAVEAGLRIHPATAYHTTWRGNDLVITPDHHLAANTPYSVSIARTAARSTSGRVATADIRITFGTRPTPQPAASSPAGPLALTPQPLLHVDPGATAAFGPNGSLLVTSATQVPPAAVPAPTPSLSLPSLLTPAATPPVAASALVRVAADGSAAGLGAPVARLAVGPAGALAAITAGDHPSLVVADATGARRAVLSPADAGSPVAWGGDDARPLVLFVQGGRLQAVDLQGHGRSPGAGVDAGRPVLAIAPGGTWVLLGPAPGASSTTSTTGTDTSTPSANASATPGEAAGALLVDLRTGTSRALSGVAGPATFSGDGGRLAYADTSTASPSVAEVATDGTATARELEAAPSGDASVGGLSLDGDGGRALVLWNSSAGSMLDAVDTATGAVFARLTASAGLAAPVISGAGDRLAVVQNGAAGPTLAAADLPAAGQAPGKAAVPAAVLDLLSRLVDAQLRTQERAAALHALTAGGVTFDLDSLTPTGLTRGLVVSATPVDGGSAVTAHVRLVRDPSDGRPVPGFVDETIVVDRSADGGYAVTSAEVGSLVDEPPGPQVLHVDTQSDHGTTVVRVTLDSDMDASSVAGAVQMIDPAGHPLDSRSYHVDYDDATRTLTVTLDPAAHAARLTLGTALRDISGAQLYSPFSTSLVP